MVKPYCICMDFAQYKDLRGEAKKIADSIGLKSGSVAIKMYWPLRVEVVPIKGNPTSFIQKLAKEEGLSKSLSEFPIDA